MLLAASFSVQEVTFLAREVRYSEDIDKLTEAVNAYENMEGQLDQMKDDLQAKVRCLGYNFMARVPYIAEVFCSPPPVFAVPRPPHFPPIGGHIVRSRAAIFDFFPDR